MTYALIDNATLTAVQRIEGHILTKSRDSVDTDIVAFENYIQSILFYDRIIAVDDYIPAHRDDRVSHFNNISFINKRDSGLDEIEAVAKSQSDELRPQLHGGEFVNSDFRSLLELLQTHIVCTWDISSSVYHLTLKNLSSNCREFEKYGNIAAAIFSELGDAAESGNRTNGNVELLDQYGEPIRKGYKVPGALWGDGTSSGEASDAIKAFVASLVWLANRSIFYSLAAKHLQADTFLYPIRQAYQQAYLSKTCQYGFDYAKRIVEHFSTSLEDDLVDIHSGGKTTATATILPVFSAWLAKETGDPKYIVEAAYNIRNNSDFVEAREKMREIRRLFDESDLADANKSITALVTEISKASNNMRIKYGIKTRQGVPVTKLIHVYNTVASLQSLPKVPTFNFKVKLPEFFYNLRQPRGFCAIYRNLTHDLSTAWALGEARDILGSKILLDQKVRSYNPKQELPKYKNTHSRFKSPM